MMHHSYTTTANKLMAVLALVLLQACSTLVATPQATKSEDDLSTTAAHAAWARVLATHVNAQGQVDFAGLTRAPQDLHAYVRFVARVKSDDMANAQDRLAHHLNAYNALSMFNVIDLGIPASNASLLQRYRFFISRKHTIGGQHISLYAYENEVIRKLGEPRIHWALNCSSVSCPVLPREPFEGVRLEQQLERDARLFFADPRNMRIDALMQTVHLSEIFSFFPEDFAPAQATSISPHLIAYANRYAPVAADPTWQVKFVPYDWTIANWRR